MKRKIDTANHENSVSDEDNLGKPVDEIKDDTFHHLLENLLKNSGQLNQEIINYLSEQNFDAEATDGHRGYTPLQYMCHIKRIAPKTVYNVIKKSNDNTMKQGIGARPLGVACRENNLIAVILLLLDGRDFGLKLKAFDFESYLKKYIEGTDLDEKACAEHIRGLITAAKNSRVTLETEVGKLSLECLIKLPAEHLRKLAGDGYLPKDHLLELKEKNIFSIDGGKYFSKNSRKKIFTFLCCMKRLDNNVNKQGNHSKSNKVQRPFKLGTCVSKTIILPQIFYNAAVTASEENNKLKLEPKLKPKPKSKNNCTAILKK